MKKYIMLNLTAFNGSSTNDKTSAHRRAQTSLTRHDLPSVHQPPPVSIVPAPSLLLPPAVRTDDGSFGAERDAEALSHVDDPVVELVGGLRIGRRAAADLTRL